MRSHLWRSVQSGLPESAHGSPELVKHTLLVEVDGMSSNIISLAGGCHHTSAVYLVPQHGLNC